VTPNDYPTLETEGDLAGRWRWRGMTPSPEQRAHQLWNGVLAQFIMVDRSSCEPLALIYAYKASQRDGTAYMAVLKFNPKQRGDRRVRRQYEPAIADLVAVEIGAPLGEAGAPPERADRRLAVEAPGKAWVIGASPVVAMIESAVRKPMSPRARKWSRPVADAAPTRATRAQRRRRQRWWVMVSST
jgi:hypothetical protein